MKKTHIKLNKKCSVDVGNVAVMLLERKEENTLTVSAGGKRR